MAGHAFYQQTPLRFECTGCGACCLGGPGHFVAVSAAEAEDIREHLALQPGWFRRRYLVSLEGGRQGIRLEADGRCPFLGQDRRCRIYALRPAQCRSYPWWPEIVNTKAGWAAEARRCEGMNRGATVPVSTIERELRTTARDRGGLTT
jgi:hypothetical protein